MYELLCLHPPTNSGRQSTAVLWLALGRGGISVGNASIFELRVPSFRASAVPGTAGGFALPLVFAVGILTAAAVAVQPL